MLLSCYNNWAAMLTVTDCSRSSVPPWLKLGKYHHKATYSMVLVWQALFPGSRHLFGTDIKLGNLWSSCLLEAEKVSQMLESQTVLCDLMYWSIGGHNPCNCTVKPRLSGMHLSGNTAIRTVFLGNEKTQRYFAPFSRKSVFSEPDSSFGNQTMFYNDQKSVLSGHAPECHWLQG